MMNVKAIVMEGNETSNKGFERLKNSSIEVGNEFEIKKFNAILPEDVNNTMEKYGLKWNWPWTKREIDKQTGIEKQPYATQVKERRIACFLSHYMIWRESFEIDEPILILEHDALFIEKFDPIDALYSDYWFIGINDPRRATRKEMVFFKEIEKRLDKIQPCPIIDNMKIAQGLAGGSAYIVKPDGGLALVKAAQKYGAWPNDALLCMQLFPGKLGVTKTFYTKVQGLPSTTSTSR